MLMNGRNLNMIKKYKKNSKKDTQTYPDDWKIFSSTFGGLLDFGGLVLRAAHMLIHLIGIFGG